MLYHFWVTLGYHFCIRLPRHQGYPRAIHLCPTAVKVGPLGIGHSHLGWLVSYWFWKISTTCTQLNDTCFRSISWLIITYVHISYFLFIYVQSKTNFMVNIPPLFQMLRPKVRTLRNFTWPGRHSVVDALVHLMPRGILHQHLPTTCKVMPACASNDR